MTVEVSKEPLWPNKTDADNPMNQSALVTNAYKLEPSAENACRQVGFPSDWSRKLREILLANYKA